VVAVRINFGCGTDYREGWVNLDVAEETKWRSGDRKPDVLITAGSSILPFDSGTVDYVLLDNVIEHIPVDKIHALLEELRRILKAGGTMEIYVPHFTGIGVKYLEHVRGYGINSFWYWHQYFDVKQRLLLISRSRCSGFSAVQCVNRLNFLFNGSNLWQQVCEKFVPGGFEEVHYVMIKRK
jgi:predicted SAM-dependent methyltransferase